MTARFAITLIIFQYLYHNDTEKVYSISKDDNFLILKMGKSFGATARGMKSETRFSTL